MKNNLDLVKLEVKVRDLQEVIDHLEKENKDLREQIVWLEKRSGYNYHER